MRFRCVVFSCFSKKAGPVHICPCGIERSHVAPDPPRFRLPCRPVLVLPPHRYLEEVGYTDTILDMRSKRVRSLLGRSLELNGAAEPSEGGPRAPPAPGGLSGGASLLVKQIEEQIKRNAAGQDSKERLGGPVLEQIPFLQNCEARTPSWTACSARSHA